MKKRVVIIGAGASGMTAAIFAARQGADVVLLEHMDRVGKKILSTGNGKCNLSNRKIDSACYNSGNPKFPLWVLDRFTVEMTLDFFKELGIVIKDRNGYLYPYSGQASSVLDILREELAARRIRVATGCAVGKIRETGKTAGGFIVETNQGEFPADALILAAGSQAAPATGSDGSGYKLARQLGHRVIKPLPALVQLRCREKFYRQISGVRTEASVAILDGESTVLALDRGELQLTDYGISGIPVFQVSRFAARNLDAGRATFARIDFFPEASTGETRKLLLDRRRSCASKQMEEFFTGWFHRKLAALFLKLAEIRPERPVKSLTDAEVNRLLSLIKAWETEITAVNSFENAQTCCGGVDVNEIDPETMESKKKKGLYLVGELLDVDGICGGYNLQWAWSTGAIAGTHAGRQ